MNTFLNRRRVFAAVFLFLAAAMVILGETFIKQRLSPFGTLLYWTACLFATVAAILCALLDLGRSVRESHQKQRELLEETVREINAERERRNPASRATPKSR